MTPPSNRARAAVRALLALLVTGALPALGGVASAHEYWLDPLDATPALDQPVLAQVRNGENYAGQAYPFDPVRFTRIEMIGPGGVEALDGRIGDRPALRATPQGPGLHALLLETNTRTVEYAELAKFEAFLEFHGLRGIAARHAERGLPTTGILESYSRHARAFLDVHAPDAPPADAAQVAAVLAPQGLAYELVLEADPFTTGETVVRALFEGRAMPDVQVELFTRDADGVVSRRVARTDAQGRTSFDTHAAGDYLFNSVHLIGAAGAAEDGGAGAQWRSFWASLVLERESPVVP